VVPSGMFWNGESGVWLGCVLECQSVVFAALRRNLGALLVEVEVVMIMR